MKKVTTVLAVLGGGSMFVAVTAAALGPVDPSAIKVLVPRTASASPAAPKALAAPVGVPLSGVARAAAIARIHNIVGVNGPRFPGFGTPSAFTVALGALTSVPSGVSVNILGMTGLQPPPSGSGYEGLFLGASDHSPIGTGRVVLTGLPLGTWLVQCNVSATGDFSVTVGTQRGDTSNGATETIPATSSGLTFAAVFSAGTGYLDISNVQDWLWQSCSFEPAQ